jgi:hypothetical protein
MKQFIFASIILGAVALGLLPNEAIAGIAVLATRRYGISAGETIGQVTEAVGAATVGDSMEFTVDLAGTNLTGAGAREKVLLALEIIKAHITKGNWPPA